MTILKDKTAIVTGASAGIGQATARLFASEGARLVVVARRKQQLDDLVAEIVADGGTAIAHVGDVRDEACARTAVELAVETFGGLDIAFNNAGIMGEMGPITEMSRDDWDDTIDTNLTGAFLSAKHQIPAMLKNGGGSLVFTSSFVGYTAGFPGAAAYAAGKAGLVGLTQAIATEYGPQGIRANTVLPGATDTAMANKFAPTADERAFVIGLNALKRMAAPEELAQSVLYLASDASSFTTGAALLVDGGVSINRT